MEDLAACAVARISLDRMTKSLMPFIGSYRLA
jgi:hypothetical protein